MKPLMTQNPVYYNNPSVKKITNTIIDAVDTTISNDDIYVHCPSATVPNDFNSYLWVCEDTSGDLNAGQRYAFGIPIGCNHSYNGGDIIYQVTATMSFFNSGGAVYYPFFGRATASSITASDATPSNILNEGTIILPSEHVTASSTWANISCRCDVFKFGDTSNTYPYIVGFVVDNPTGTGVQFDSLRAYVSVRAYIDEIRPFTPVR